MHTKAWLGRTVFIALSLTALACGDGDGDDGDGAGASFSEGSTCGLAVQTSGGLSVSVPASAKPTCLAQSDSDVIDAAFIYPVDTFSSLQLQVLWIEPGETGEFPAVIALAGASGDVWEGEECVATITEHELVMEGELGAQQYHVEGRVRCSGPLVPEEGAGEGVNLKALSFVVTASWST